MSKAINPGNMLPPDLRAEWERICAMSADELNAALSEHMESMADRMVRIALVLRRKEELGHDLTGIKIGLIDYLRQIAYGQLLPDVVARFGSSRVLPLIARLPLPDQRKCLEAEGVKLAVLSGDGAVSFRMVDPGELSARERKQVFAAGHVREPDEQAAWLRHQPLRDRLARSPVVVDKRHGELVVSGENVRITREQLLMYLASLG